MADADQTETDTEFMDGIKKHQVCINIDFIDHDIIVYGEISSDGINISPVTRCFQDDRNCELTDCLNCPFTDKTMERKIYKKYEKAVVELLKDAYAKIEAMRDKQSDYL